MNYDVIVVGSGAGGLSTAVTAAHLGLSVLVLEKDAVVGGTTAWSGGWMWLPRNFMAIDAGIIEPLEVPLNYLREEVSGLEEEKAIAFLKIAPVMARFFQQNTAVQFIDGNKIADFHGRSKHALTGGRSLGAKEFNGRELGKRRKDLRSPLDLVSPMGLQIAAGADLRHFFNATRKWASFTHVLKKYAVHFYDILTTGRGQQLLNGNALAARLFKSALDAGVEVKTNAGVDEIIRKDGRITGVRVGEQIYQARKAVVLATGGFPHDTLRQAKLFPAHLTHASAAPPSNTGDGLNLGETVGGNVREDYKHAGAWTVVSHIDGRTHAFPHLVERGKAGIIGVLDNGKRFTNEGNAYLDVAEALIATGQPHAWLICDHAFQRRYGLGHARPRPYPLKHWLDNGYLKRGANIEDLAKATGINVEGLKTTLEEFNLHAKNGEDPLYNRGETPYNKGLGEPEQQPNPCVRVIDQAPFYAVKIGLGSLGTFAGLDCDENAQVLDVKKRPIEGLFAVGNDMASIFKGNYPSGGITLAPAMTFGYIAAHKIANIPLENNK